MEVGKSEKYVPVPIETTAFIGTYEGQDGLLIAFLLFDSLPEPRPTFLIPFSVSLPRIAG